MTFRKACSFFVVVMVLSFGALSGSALSQTIMEVPKAEMPGAPVASHSCWVVRQNAVMTFIRRDSDVETINSGNWGWLYSSRLGIPLMRFYRGGIFV